MDAALIASASLLGLAGAPHCAAMCSAPCAALTGSGGRPAQASFHLARLVSYALAGALVSASVGALASWSAWSPALRPLWTLLNAAALLLGLWLLVRGRQPAWLARFGRTPPALDVRADGWRGMQAPVQAPLRAPLRAGAAGALWAAWPCGLLQSALVVAALTSDAASGAAAMAGFALMSMPGLLAGGWLWARVVGGDAGSSAGTGAGAVRERWAVRAAGLMLAGASVWALGHQWAPAVLAYCSTLW